MVPILRNELGYEKHTFAGYDINDMKKVRTQRHSLILQGEPTESGHRRVEYVIKAVIETHGPDIKKYYECFKRRAEKGQCHHRPYFGCREFPCDFEWAPDARPAVSLNKSYGIIFRDFDFEPVWNHWLGDQRPGSWKDTNGRAVSPVPLHPLNAVAKDGWITVAEVVETNGRKEVKLL